MRLIRYVIAGLAATGIHVGSVFALVEIFSWDPVTAAFPAFLLALTASYLVNHHWTFSASGSYRHHFPRYTLVALGGLSLNLAIMQVTVHLLGWPYAVGLALVVAVVPLAGFLLQRDWAFGQTAYME